MRKVVLLLLETLDSGKVIAPTVILIPFQVIGVGTLFKEIQMLLILILLNGIEADFL